MKNSIHRTVRSLTEKPIIGKPLRFLVAIVRLPKTRYRVSQIGSRLRVVGLEISTLKDKIKLRENMDKEINRQISEVRQVMAEIHKQTSDISKHIHDIRGQINDSIQQTNDTRQQLDAMGLQINDTRQQSEAMVHQINGLIHHRLLFESDVLPGITEALQYQENLMKSLPVVLRRHERKLREFKN